MRWKDREEECIAPAPLMAPKDDTASPAPAPGTVAQAQLHAYWVLYGQIKGYKYALLEICDAETADC